jgi:hypothetical protein
LQKIALVLKGEAGDVGHLGLAIYPRVGQVGEVTRAADDIKVGVEVILGCLRDGSLRVGSAFRDVLLDD